MGMRRTIAAIVLPATLCGTCFSAETPEIPPEVVAIETLCNQWFEACSASDQETLLPLYHPDKADGIDREIEQMTRMRQIAPGIKFKLMVVKYADSVADAVSAPFKIDHPQAPDEAVMILHLAKIEGRWRVLYNSGDVLRSVPDSYDHFRRKYPNGHIWVDSSAAQWIRPVAAAAEGALTVDDVFKDIPHSYPTAEIVEKLSETIYDKTVFESWFTDDPDGTRTLLELYRNKSKDPNYAEKILRAARGGLRGAGRQGPYIISMLGNQYIWGVTEQNEDAIELLYYASFNKDLVGNAVYYGLSVTRAPKSPEILKRCVELCMVDAGVGRVLWGTRGQHEQMLPYLGPWLRHDDPVVSDRAAVLVKVLRGELDYDEFRKQQKLEHDKALIGDKLPQIRRILADGSSDQRRKMLDQIRRRALTSLFDESFRDPLLACLSDGHPEVRCRAIGFSGDLFCKPGEFKPEIIAMMEELSRDSDSKVRDAVAVFTGSKWIWGSFEQESRAKEIMMRLAKDHDRGVRYNAVYYGLSVFRDKDDEVIKTLIDLAVDPSKDGDIGRIGWGLLRGADKDKIRAVLQPHLDAGGATAERARMLQGTIFTSAEIPADETPVDEVPAADQPADEPPGGR